ncbi:probable cytochrome P450 305a1 [Stomoxys calcitrans]|uniref:probable cytochrome P450 305a1 n=1 Tax=Stomoxys calcitrans TaxID=35570 RepID=UPI0027E31635|nr:probable cytochrome P450 305a1 [Stomoxys calcitrans]
MVPLLIFIAIIVCYVAFMLWQSMRRPNNYPPGPDFVPWAGNTMQLRKQAAALGGQHKAFEKWSKEYNSNILGLKLGQDYVVVVLTYQLVKEVNLQEVFEGRPDTFFLRLRTMGTRKGITCTDGKLWYEHRNFAMKQMRNVGYGRSEMEKRIEKETHSLLKFIYELSSVPVFPSTFLAQSVINVLWSMTAGQRFERGDKRMAKLLSLMGRRSKVFDISGGLLTQFPWLRFVAPNKTGYNLIRQLNKEMYDFFMESIEHHKTTMTKENAEQDLIYAYLWEMQQEISNNNENTTFNETQLVMTILDLFIAGSQTTSTTIDLSLMTLAMKPEIEKRIYEEIIANTKSKEFPNLGNKSYYPYTEAFLMEVQRFYHIAPITGPRRALWDTKLAGYDIPKNTTIFITASSVLKDHDHWVDPDVFRPERFIDAEGRTFRDEYFIPFGMGRRRCLGDALARACLFSFVVKIVENFKLLLTQNKEDQPTMKLLPGITLSPKPYKLKFVPRHEHFPYQD